MGTLELPIRIRISTGDTDSPSTVTAARLSSLGNTQSSRQLDSNIHVGWATGQQHSCLLGNWTATFMLAGRLDSIIHVGWATGQQHSCWLGNWTATFMFAGQLDSSIHVGWATEQQHSCWLGNTQSSGQLNSKFSLGNTEFEQQMFAV